MRDIKVNSIWRSKPQGESKSWGGEKLVLAATDDYVIIRNKFVSTIFPHTNKEEVVPRSEFEHVYVTGDEARTEISRRAMAVLTSVSETPKYGNPLPMVFGDGNYSFRTANRLVIRFTRDGHYYVEDPDNTSNPVSSLDAEWIAKKSAEFRNYYRASRYSYGW